jgi:cyclic pyranopterin phosphate synthase
MVITLKEIYDHFPRYVQHFIYSSYLVYGRQIRNVKNRIKYGQADFFTDLDIEINTSCNRRCSCCPNSIYDRGLLKNEELMDEKLFKKIIDELAEIQFDGRISPHLYGEPLLDKRLSDFVVYIKKKIPKSQIRIFSNGDYLTVEMYHRLVNAGVTAFFVTQYGPSVPKPIKELTEYLKTNRNKNVQFKYRKFTEVTPLFNRGGEIKLQMINPIPRCKHPHNPLAIDYEGNIILCCNDYHSTIIFGNLRNNSLIEIWNSEPYRNSRNQLKKGIYTADICRKCVGLA